MTLTFLTPPVPDELITLILLRVPLKYLLRCKSVSKPWLSLISSTPFIKSQLAFASATTADESLIVHSQDLRSPISLISLVSRKTVARLRFPHVSNAASIQTENECESQCLIVGSACGIVCVHSFCSKIYLWNPATKQSKLIPPPMVRDDFIYRVSLGFGFDERENDFKVVRMIMRHMHCEVYSANADAWRKVEITPIDMPGLNNNFEVCVDGFLLSVGCDHGMMSFDLNREVFHCAIKLPNARFTHVEDYTRITHYNDSVGVIIYGGMIDEDSTKINLWRLDDEACFRIGGIEASWTLMLNINVKPSVVCVHGYLSSGELLLMDCYDGWCLYNPNTEEFRVFSDYFPPGMFKYTESLFTIPGSKPVINSNALN